MADNGPYYASNVSLTSLHPVLDHCRTLGNRLENLDLRIDEHKTSQSGHVSGRGTATQQSIDAESTAILADYRVLIEEIRQLKALPEATESINKFQVGALDRNIRKSINDFHQSEASFRYQLESQQRRQYRIAYPEANEHEITQAIREGTDSQIFQQALLSSNRRGKAKSTLSSVKQRHEQIQHIEKTMTELMNLFDTLDAEVVRQGFDVVHMEESAQEMELELGKATQEVTQAAGLAKRTRRKKFICLGLVILILLLVALVVVIALKATGHL